MSMYKNVRVLPAEGFGLNWNSRPSWAFPVHGAQRAVEVRCAERDVSGQYESGHRLMKVYSVYTDQGFFWAMTGTDGMWRLRDSHAF